MIITDKIYTTKRQAEDDYFSLIRTIKNSVWLSETAKHLNISPYDMYEIVKMENGKWRINATPEHLVATQAFYKIV
jgi:hypothetical protein